MQQMCGISTNFVISFELKTCTHNIRIPHVTYYTTLDHKAKKNSLNKFVDIILKSH